MTASTQNLSIILTAVDNASRVLKNVNNTVTSTKNSLDQATAGAKKFTKTVWLLATVGGGLATREFMNFEKQMSKVKAITWATNEEYKQMTDLAKKMGATTAFTWKEAWDALEFLGMAGLSVKESMDALPWALELAAAWNLSLWESADIATNIMAQFGIEASDIGRVNDVLAKSATSANTSVQEMAEAMKYMWPVANALKVPLEETASAVNILANNGIKWGMAGQSFSASLLRITKLTPKMQESVDALNVSLFDQNGEFVGLTDTVKQLEEGTKSMTDEEKAKHISTLFGIQSTKQWLTLLKEGSWEMEKYTESLENAEGSAKKMAETQLDNLAGSFTLLKSAVSGAMIEIWGAISVHLRPAIDWLTGAISNWRTNWENLSPAMQTTIKTVLTITGAIAGLVLVIGTVSMILTPLIAGFGVLTTVLGTVITVVKGLWIALRFLALNPIGMVITAIWAGILIGIAIVKNWDLIKEKAVQLWGFLVDLMWKFGFLLWPIGLVIQIGIQVYKNWDTIKEKVGIAMDAISEKASSWSKALWKIIYDSIEWIKSAYSTGLNWISDKIASITGFMSEIWTWAMETMKSIGTWAWESIKGTISWVIDGLTSKFTSFQESISAIYNKVSGWLKKIFKWESDAKASASNISSQANNVSGARAIGGTVGRGKQYLVWENWPELFSPGTTWNITPNNQLWGGWGDVNVTIQVNGSDDPQATARAIKDVLTRELQMYKNFWIS